MSQDEIKVAFLQRSPTLLALQAMIAALRSTFGDALRGEFRRAVESEIGTYRARALSEPEHAEAFTEAADVLEECILGEDDPLGPQQR